MANIKLKNKVGDVTTYNGVDIMRVPAAESSAMIDFVDTSSADAVAGDILASKTAFVGTTKLTGIIPTKTDTDITSEGGVVTIPAGYYAQQYTKQGDPSGDATAVASDILAGKTAYSKGAKLTGTIPTKSSADMSIVDNTVTAAAGYYAEATSKSLTVDTLTDAIISGQAYEEATGDYAWKSTVQIPKGYHNAQTIEKSFSEVFPAPETPGTSADVLIGKQFFDKDGKVITGVMANNSAVSASIVANGGTYTVPAGYHNGSGVVTANIPVYDGTVSS